MGLIIRVTFSVILIFLSENAIRRRGYVKGYSLKKYLTDQSRIMNHMFLFSFKKCLGTETVQCLGTKTLL